MATNTTGLRIEREGDSLNATGCIEDLEGGLYHVVLYDVEANGTVDWHNSALFFTAALNLTSPDQLNTGESTIIKLLDKLFLLYVIHEFVCCHTFCMVYESQSKDLHLIILGFMWRFCALATSRV